MGGSGVGDTRGVPLWGHSPPPPLGAGAAGRALLGGVEGHSAAAPGRHKSLRCGGGPALGGRAGGARTAADGARERGEAVGHPRGRAVREGGAAGAAALPGRECGGGRGGGLGRGWAAGSADGRARERIAARGCGTRVGVRGAHRCLWPCPAVDGDVWPRSPTAAPLRLQPPRTPGCPALSPTPPRPSPPVPPRAPCSTSFASTSPRGPAVCAWRYPWPAASPSCTRSCGATVSAPRPPPRPPTCDPAVGDASPRPQGCTNPAWCTATSAVRTCWCATTARAPSGTSGSPWRCRPALTAAAGRERRTSAG